MSKFSATDSLLGYLYQLRMGLLWSLRRLKDETAFSVSMETLDDVTFEGPDGIAADLLQTKLHRNSDATITNASVDFWKTLRIWIAGRGDGSISSTATLHLLTTATAPDGTIARALTLRDRDERAALTAMDATAKTSTNEKCAAGCKAFLALDVAAREALVASIIVIDRAPGTAALDAELRKEFLLSVARDDLEPFLEALEGWWNRRAIRQLAHITSTPITAPEVDGRVSTLRDQFRRDPHRGDDEVVSRRVPDSLGALPRSALERDVLSRLSDSSYVVLQGLSGAGKTVLAARLAHQLQGSFENVIWCDARKIDRVEQLDALLVAHANRTPSVADLLRTEHVLLVLDDPALALSELPKIDCGAQSRILVTTQAEVGAHVVVIGDLEMDEARGVLTTGVSSECPVELFTRIYDAIGGHALTMHALNRLALKDGWGAVEDCLETDGVARLRDQWKENIFQRILKRHSDALSLELQFVKWCGSPRINLRLARLASSLTIDALDERGFLVATTPGYARVHDLVYGAIKEVVTLSDENGSRFTEGLVRLVRKESDSDRPLLQRIARSHEDLFRRLLSEERNPALVYMVAMSRESAESIDLLGDPLSDAHTLMKRATMQGASLELRAIIEAAEALVTLRKEFRPDDVRGGQEASLAAFTLLLTHSALSPDQRRMLTHHRAKMLVQLGQKAEAEALFKDLLVEDPTFAAARIQLANGILGKEDAIAECELLLKQHASHPGQVTLNIVLEALRHLAYHGADLEKHQQLILSTIAHTSRIDRADAMRLIASIAQRAWFHAPHVIPPMLSAVDLRGGSPSPSEAFHWGQVHKYAALATSNSAKRESLLQDAIKFYRIGPMQKEFERTHYAEALLLTGNVREAGEQLQSVAEPKRNAFWYQRQAQVLSALDQHVEALVDMEKALAKLTDLTLRPVFLADRFRIRLASGDSKAIEDLDAAVAALPEGHWLRMALESERKELASEPWPV